MNGRNGQQLVQLVQVLEAVRRSIPEVSKIDHDNEA